MRVHAACGFQIQYLPVIENLKFTRGFNKVMGNIRPELIGNYLNRSGLLISLILNQTSIKDEVTTTYEFNVWNSCPKTLFINQWLEILLR